MNSFAGANSRSANRADCFRFVDAIAGGGKTYAMTDYIARRAQAGLRFIVALPSQLVVEQCADDLKARHPNVGCAAVHGATRPGKSPVKLIIEKISEVRRSGQAGFVLVITHAALAILPAFCRGGWHLIVDEVPSATAAFTHNALSNGVRRSLTITSIGPRYCRIEVRRDCRSMWQKIAAGLFDHYQGSSWFTLWRYKALAAVLLNPHHEVFGLREQWTLAALHNADTQVAFFSLLNPSVFDGFAGTPTIMAAGIKDTLLYHPWTIRHGITWLPHTAITRRLRATAHYNGDLLSIYCATERDYSKKLRNTSLAEPKQESEEIVRHTKERTYTMSDNFFRLDADEPIGTVQEEFVAAAVRLFGHDGFAYLANNDSANLTATIGERLPNTPHGLNQYQNLHKAAIFSALNLTPAHIKFLGSLGVSPDEIRGAIAYQAAYQAALRISLRDPFDRHAKIIVVPDKGCAEYIATMFPGSAVKPLGGRLAAVAPDKRKTKGGKRGRDVQDAECKRQYRKEQELKRQMGLYLLDDPKSPRIGMSLFMNKDTPSPYEVIGWPGIDLFVEWLHALSNDTHASKADNRLISPSIFNTQRAIDAGVFNKWGKPRKRARVNVESSVGIWLDNDLGVMTHEEFAALFPDLQMVIYNTYSSKAGALKYRVWIPTTHAMDAELYLFITKQIKTKVEEHGNGYRSHSWLIRWIENYKRDHGRWPCEDEVPYANHGFDWGKTMPENLMYLPCKAADPDPAASFFLDLRDGLRRPLDVEAWITHPIADVRPEPAQEPLALVLVAPPAPVAAPASTPMQRLVAAMQKQQHQSYQQQQQGRTAAAINRWRSYHAGSGEANNKFYALGCALQDAGHDLTAVRALLKQEATNIDRKAQIDSIIDSLRKRHR